MTEDMNININSIVFDPDLYITFDKKLKKDDVVNLQYKFEIDYSGSMVQDRLMCIEKILKTEKILSVKLECLNAIKSLYTEIVQTIERIQASVR